MKISASYSSVVEDSNYHSYVCLYPIEFYEIYLKYLKEEIEKAASLNPSKPLVIGIGIGGEFSLVPKLARKASLRSEEFSSNESARELEGKLRNYARKFPNVVSINIETFPAHITKRPIWVFGNYESEKQVDSAR